MIITEINKKMKKIKILLLILCMTFSFASNAQSKVAHINSTELVSSMPEMEEAKAELEKLAKTYENDIQTMAAELQSKVKQYDTEAKNPLNFAEGFDAIDPVTKQYINPKLMAQTDEENARRLQEVQGMEQSIRQYQSQAQQELQKKEFDLIKPISEKAQAAIIKVAKAQGFDYVLDSTGGQGVILADGKDLLEDVKKELGF